MTFFERLAAWQTRRAGVVVFLALAITTGSAFIAKDLGLDSAFTALLPEEAPSVRDLDAIGARVAGLSTLTVAVQSDQNDVPRLQAFARRLVEGLESSGDPISSVDWNVKTYDDFVQEHRVIYAGLDDLQELEGALERRLERERQSANPFYIDLEDPDESLDAVIERLEEKAAEGESRLARYPDGFYIHPDGDMLFMFVRADLSGGDSIGSRGLVRRVQGIVDELDPEASGLEVDFAGDVIVAMEEQQAIARELVIATVVTFATVLIVIFFFFRRGRAIPLLGLAIVPPVVATFAFAELSVDFLNTSTAFLGAIVLGNGINPNIVWLARYFEERRAGAEVETALAATHQGAWSGTVTASLAAAFAYGSLMATDFRGFRDFGAIGLVGMVLCWFGAMLLLPALVVLYEKWRPMKPEADRVRGGFGVALWRLVARSPKGVLVFSAVLTVASFVFIAQAVLVGPLELDFRKLKSDRDATGSVARQINARAHEVVGSSAQGNGIALLLPSVAEAQELEARLEERAGPEEADLHALEPIDAERDPAVADAGDAGDADAADAADAENEEAGESIEEALQDGPQLPRLWLAVHSLDDLLPKDQEAKRPVLESIRESMNTLRQHAEGEELERLERYSLPEEIPTLTRDDLPASVALSLTERDGTRGRILIVEANHSIWDGQYLVDWSTALRGYETSEGETPLLAGRAPVFADMIEVVVRDGPRAILYSFIATFLLLLLTFSSGRGRVLTIATLLAGIAWMAGTMAALGMKLNFLNFVAFPITFGNGVDYGVNVMRRYAQEQAIGMKDAVQRAVERTGGAVALCSLTTVIGYASLYSSANLAINSFGLAMAISEVTCVIAALLAMPAALLLLQAQAED